MQKVVDNKKIFREFASFWARTLPPSRPFSGDLEIYKQLIKKYRSREGITNILILGSTPELRDLASRFYAQVTVVDANKQMVEAMTSLRRYSTPENIVIKPWQKLTVPDKQDIVISDTGLNMLDKKDIPKVMKKVADVLKVGGYFLHRTLMYTPKKNVKVIKVIKDWRNKKIFIGDFRWLLEMYSKYSSYNRLIEVSDKSILMDNMKKLYFEGLITKSEYNRFSRYDDKVKLTIFERSKWEYHFSKYFKIVRVITSKGHLYCRDMPIFVCKKK